MRDEPGVISLEQHQHRFIVPAPVAELEHAGYVVWYNFSKSFKAFQVYLHAWRQLVKHGSEAIAEMARGRHHPRERFLAIEQFLRLGEEAVRLDRVAKAGRRLLAPFAERRRRREAIEAVVDLDRVELFRITLEPSPLRQAFGIE